MRRNVRVSAKVMPGGSSFGQEYSMTETSLGAGMSGPVLLAKRRGAEASDELVAVKRLAKHGLPKRGLARLFREAETYLKLDHPNIAKLIRVCDDSKYVYLVMEHCSGGALSSRLCKLGRFAESDAADVVGQVLGAVNYCHRHPCGVVCHRDLKHANILYGSQADGATLKLIDFGLSCVLSRDKRSVSGYAGTLHYAAPEVIFSKSYDESCDMWSIGVITYSLLCGRAPFKAATEGQLVKKIACESQDMLGSSWEGISDCAKEFVQKLLAKDPRQRPTAAEALQLPWLARRRTAPRPEVLQSLWTFAHEHAVRRAVAAFVVFAQGAPACADVALLEEQFHALDRDSDGTISVAELVQAMQSCLLVDEAEARWVFRQLSVVGDARLHQSEFVAAVLGTRLLGDRRTVHEAFARFDEDKNGTIELRELELALGKRFCGEPTSDIFRQCDTNGDRTIDIEEFSAAVLPGLGPALEKAPCSAVEADGRHLHRRAASPQRPFCGAAGGDAARWECSGRGSPRSPPTLLRQRCGLRQRQRRRTFAGTSCAGRHGGKAASETSSF